MSSPTIVDIPHTLGRAEATRRIRSRIGDLPKHIPGGMADVTAAWPAENRMALDVKAMGQSLAATIEVEDRVVRVSMVLPMMLSFMAGTIAAGIQKTGGQLLLGDDSKAG